MKKNPEGYLKPRIKIQPCTFCDLMGPWYSGVCESCMPIRDKVHKQVLQEGVHSYQSANQRIKDIVKSKSSVKKIKKAFFDKLLNIKNIII